MYLVILGLMAVSFVLWRDLAKLRARVADLEGDIWSRSFEPRESPEPTLPPKEERPAPERRPARAVSARDSAVVVEQAPAAPAIEEQDPLVTDQPVAPDPQFTADPPVEADDTAPRLGFEELFGRRLPIWAGGVTLAVAGFLIVKYSIDVGLLSPLVRMILGLLFGSALIGAAEAALRGELFVRDARVRQSLAGAGIATLYATILVAANIYQLIGPLAAFVGMALVTAAAIGLSLRFGAPSAILGLVGGLAAPALVGSESPNVPLLASYLALTVGGLCAVSRQQRWAWLGAGALVGGFGWGLLLLLGGAMDAGSTLSLGILILLLAVAFPLLFLARPGESLRLAAGLVGCAQMAALVAVGGFAPLNWALFGLISAACVWLSRREAGFERLPAAGLAIAILLAGAWPSPEPILLGAVIAGIAAIFGGPALVRLWRPDGSIDDAIAIAVCAAAILVLPMLHLYRPGGDADGAFALLAMIGSAIAGTAAMLGWRSATRTADWRFALLVATASGLLVAAASLALPVWAVAPAGALVASALLLFARRAADPRIAITAWGSLVVTLALLAAGLTADQLRRMSGETAPADIAQALRWLGPAAMAIVFALRADWRGRGAVAQPLAMLLAYGAVAQILPPLLLPLVPALLLAGLALARLPVPIAAAVTGWALILLWALIPAASWFNAAIWSLSGVPFFGPIAPGLADAALKLAIPAAAIAFAARRSDWPRDLRLAANASAVVLATIAAHSTFKQLLMIDSDARFVALGYAERTLWEAQLAALALLAWQWRQRMLTIALAAASLMHFAWFSLVVHNPLWSAQAAGPWLIPAFGIAFAILAATHRAALLTALDRARDWIRIILIPLFALSMLRWAFSGSILSATPVGQSEDIARSLLGALIAILYLQWGIRAALRDWRIASLALMLLTVAKVFLRDASGLDGLLRVASFAALGFSLIGIGWLYSRYLPDPDRPRPDPA